MLGSIFLRFITVVLILDFGFGWERAALIYHDDSRAQESWKRHVMQIDKVGVFTGRWIFDAAIFTRDTPWMYYGEGLTGKDVELTLQILFQDAASLDSAITDLLKLHHAPALPIKVSIGVPYFNNKVEKLKIYGVIYDLTKPAEREAVIKYYVNQIKAMSVAAKWTNLELYGAYYHREDMAVLNDDLKAITFFNQESHAIGMKTVWVPYYDAPSAWSGQSFGFDVVVVQPRYSFLSPIDSGNVRADRLYSTGYKSANSHLCFEYELRGRGERKLENWIAHQYLSIAQETGAWQFPQVFFVGTTSDLFDKIEDQQSALGDSWLAYDDLTRYLLGETIENFEIPLKWTPNSTGDILTQTFSFDVPILEISSIRLDFNDDRHWTPWRGKISVMFNNDGLWLYAMRLGSDEINPSYNSISVPLSVPLIMHQTEVVTITIQLDREKATPWPNVLRLAIGRFEAPTIANPIFEEVSLTSRPLKAEFYPDSKDTHLGFETGKLTDGQRSPDGTWWWPGSMGWNLLNARFTVTITLLNMHTITAVRIIAYSDAGAGINWPTNVAALVSTECVPQATGIIGKGKSCIPSASSGAASLVYHSSPYSANQNGVITLPFDNEPGRFVTVTGICFAWCLFDEIEIVDNQGQTISVGKPYRVTPRPGSQMRDPLSPYTDNSNLLVDGNIASQWMNGGSWADGIQGLNAFAETSWDKYRLVSGIVIWIISELPSYGIILPDYVVIELRDENLIWQSAISVKPEPVSCGPSPCVMHEILPKSKLTGVRAHFPNTEYWFMISEISMY